MPYKQLTQRIKSLYEKKNKRNKHFKTCTNLLLFEACLPFCSSGACEHSMVKSELYGATEFGFSRSFSHWRGTVVMEIRLLPEKGATDHSAFVSLRKCSEF